MSETIYQNKRERADYILNIILNSLFIGIFAFSLLFVWGSSISETFVDGYNNVTYCTQVDAIYLFKTGWEGIREYSDKVMIIKLVIALISYILTIVGVYICSINGLINVIKSLIKKDDFTAHKYFIFGALIYLAYYAMTGFLFSGYVNETNITVTYAAGWGTSGMNVLLNIGTLLIGGYYCFTKFDKDNVKGFVGSIFLCVTIGTMINLIQNASFCMFSFASLGEGLNYSTEVGFMNSLIFINGYFPNNKVEFYVLAFITFVPLFLLVAFVLTNICIFSLNIAKKEEANGTYLLVSAIITASIFLIVLILSNISSILMASKLTELYTNRVLGLAGTGIITGFVLSLIVLGFSITTMVLTQNKKSNKNKVIDVEINEK